MDAEELLQRYAAGERDFSGVNLEGANLVRANLSKANLRGANLAYIFLEDANLEGADLIDVNFEDATKSFQNENCYWVTDWQYYTLFNLIHDP